MLSREGWHVLMNSDLGTDRFGLNRKIRSELRLRGASLSK